MSLNLFSLFLLITSLTSFSVALFILIFGKEKFHKFLALFNISIGIWSLCIFLASLTKNPETAFFLWKSAHGIGSFVSILFFHSVVAFCKKTKPLLLKISYFYGITLSIFSFTNYYNYGVNLLFGSIYYLETHRIIFPIIMIPWFLLSAYGSWILFNYFKKLYPKKNHPRILIALFPGLGFMGGSTVFLPMVGINLYPIYIILIPIYIIAMFYAIFRHKFLNITIIIQESIKYSILITLISLLYLSSVFISEYAFKHLFGYKSFFLSLLIVIGIAFIFAPLKNKIQHFVDLVFYKKSPEEITRENELLHQEVVQTERLKSVATLASGMAHEIKNPLTAIKTFSEYLPEKLEDKEFLMKFSKIVGSEVNRIDHIVNQLLEFAKPAPLALKQIDIHDLISNTLDFLNSRFVKQNIKLEARFCQPTGEQNAEIFLTIDLNQIRQALLNIFINAIEAMPLGGTLTIETSVRYPFFVIQISDTGQGIAANDLKHIFDPFYTKKDTGTGLGLSITQRIIKEHKGRIWAKSTLGNGTTIGIEMRLEE